MKLKKLLSFAVVALFATTMSAQVVVNEMPLGSKVTDFFKAYEEEGVELEAVSCDFKNQSKDSFNYAGIKGTGSSYIAVKAEKKIKAIRLLATGNSQNSKFNPAIIGFKEVPESIITDGKLQVVDFATAIASEAKNNIKSSAIWITFDLDTVNLKAVYISRQWKKIALSEEDTQGAQIGKESQTIRVFGFQVVLDGQEMPAIPEGPVVVVDPAITSFTIAGVKATIDNAKKTITAELPYGTDVAAAVKAAVVEDNQDTLDVVIDPEAMTATLGELVYTLVITVAEEPVVPQPQGGHNVIADWATSVGTFTANGNCTTEKDWMKFPNTGLEKANYTITPSVATFSAGDTIVISTRTAIKDSAKNAQIQIYDENDQLLFTTTLLDINVSENPQETDDMFILTAATTQLKLTRYGNTNIWATAFSVWSANGETPQPATPAITAFTIAGVKATIDQKALTITAELPAGTDLAAALKDAKVEDNQDSLDVVIDAEAMTATLGELVYTLVITVAEKPDDPQPVGDALFYLQVTDEAPANDAQVAATGGIFLATSTDTKTLSVEDVKGYVESVPDDMKAAGKKGWKIQGNAQTLMISLSEGKFLAGDILYICGYNNFKISSTDANEGDVAESLATGADKNNYAVGSVTLSADADALYIKRAQSSGTVFSAIKVTRGTSTSLEENNSLNLMFADGVIFNPEHVALTVYNVNGSIIATSNTNINLNLVPAGLYIVSDGKNVMKVIR